MKKIIIILLILGLFVPFFGFLGKAQATTETDPGYYGYLSKKKVYLNLLSHKEIPDWKISAIINKLSEDGYFWMKTKKEKMNYCLDNMASNKYLNIVYEAENGDIAKDYGLPTDYRSSISAQEALTNELNAAAEQWYQFFRDIYGDDPRIDVSKTLAADIAFLKKSRWMSKNLDILYEIYWPDLKVNRKISEFTSIEKNRLEKVWGACTFKNKVKYLSPEAGGVLCRNPMDDVLWIMPYTKLSQIKNVWGLKGVVGLGSKTAARDAAAGAANVFPKTILKIPNHAISYKSRYLGMVKINLSRMFMKSSIAYAGREMLGKTITKSASRMLADPLLAKYIDKRFLLNTLDNIEIWTAKKSNGFSGGHWFGLTQPALTRSSRKVFLNEALIYSRAEIQTIKTTAHEIFHRRSNMSIFRIGYWWNAKKYYPLEEGMTEAFAQKFTKTYFKEEMKMGRLGVSYKGETRVAEELMNTFQRKYAKYGARAGEDKLYDIYFNKTLTEIDKTLGKGVHDKLHKMMLENNYDGAVDLLRKI